MEAHYNIVQSSLTDVLAQAPKGLGWEVCVIIERSCLISHCIMLSLLLSSSQHDCSFGECAAGIWAAEVLRKVAGTQIAVINGGAIK